MRGPSDKAVEAAQDAVEGRTGAAKFDAVQAVEAAYPVIIAEVVAFLRSEPDGEKLATVVEHVFGGES